MAEDPRDFDENGKFAVGNTANVEANRARKGVPNRGQWIKEQIQATCSEEALVKLKAMSMSDDIKDLEVYWRIVGKTLPQELHAQFSPADAISDAATAAAKRAGVGGNGQSAMRTQLE